jgi:acetylglutamate kinase
MIVIKYGGNALPTNNSTDPVLEAIADAFLDGDQIVLVHGGGPQIDLALTEKGIGKEKVAGYRITTPEVYDVVQSVLSGSVLRSIVNYLIGSEVNAVGLSAADGGLVVAKKFRPIVDGKPMDIGLVGEVEQTNPLILESLITEGFLPVVSPIACDQEGTGYNVNADLIAAAIGGALRADCVIFLTDVDGIYRNWPDKSTLISEISMQELKQIQPSFSDGMIPKVKAAINAIDSGAFSVRVTDGTDLELVLDALDNRGGTLVVA